MLFAKFSDAGDTMALKSYLAVGSMPAASNQLTLTSNPGFAVNDPIIVEIGGEAGAGLRGTKGVGGVWPALSYADVTAMNADTGQVANKYAWVEATGDVYQFVSSVWTIVSSVSYYFCKAVPRALITTITAINGLVLTLEASSTVATTSANVHFNNAPLINALVDAGVGPHAPNTLIIPTGEYAIGSRIRLFQRGGWTFRGNGMNVSELFSPKGAPSAHIMNTGDTPYGTLFRDFHLRGNHGNNGFGLAWDTNGVTETAVVQGDWAPRGLIFNTCVGCTALRIKVTNAFQMAVGANYATNCWAYNCEVYITDPFQVYIQWMFLWADSTGGGFADCRVDSPYLAAGFSMFRSVGIKMIRPVGRNVIIECNSSGSFLIDAPDLTIEADSLYSDQSFSINNPCININSNIQPPNASIALGGTIRNPRIVQEGRINGIDSLHGVGINADNPNITVTGTYPDGVNPKGYIQTPDYVSGTRNGALGVGADNAINVIVDGIRIVGLAGNGYGNIHADSAGCVARNCVAEVITATTEENNQDNATWIAGHP